MFDLIESCPERREGLGWTGRIVSALIHIFLLSAAIALTRGVLEASGSPLIPVDIRWPAQPGKPAPGNPAPCTCPATPVAPISIPTSIPEPGLIALDLPPGGDPGGWNPGLDSMPGLLPIGNALTGASLPLDERQVDEHPELVSHPELRYPEVLRLAGIEGRVLVELVLDSLGRAELGSARVITSPHPLFDQEALSVAGGSVYRPARLAGRAVRVRVRVPVSFALRR